MQRYWLGLVLRVGHARASGGWHHRLHDHDHHDVALSVRGLGQSGRELDRRSGLGYPGQMRLSMVVLCLLAAIGCDGATRTIDARFSTPEHTVRTLLSAYGLADATQDQIRERMAAHDRFEMQSRATFRACFEDLGTQAASEGVAGFVFGALAAGRDDLRVEITGDRATVSPRAGVEIVMHRGDDGAFRIVLRESVPAEVRARMASLAQHADDRLRRGIVE